MKKPISFLPLLSILLSSCNFGQRIDVFVNYSLLKIDKKSEGMVSSDVLIKSDFKQFYKMAEIGEEFIFYIWGSDCSFCKKITSPLLNYFISTKTEGYYFDRQNTSKEDFEDYAKLYSFVDGLKPNIESPTFYFVKGNKVVSKNSYVPQLSTDSAFRNTFNNSVSKISAIVTLRKYDDIKEIMGKELNYQIISYKRNIEFLGTFIKGDFKNFTKKIKQNRNKLYIVKVDDLSEDELLKIKQDESIAYLVDNDIYFSTYKNGEQDLSKTSTDIEEIKNIIK